MNWRNSSDRYGILSIGLHWLMLSLFIALYACIELHDLFPKGDSLRATLKTWHFMLGLSVFALAWLRLITYTTAPIPRIKPTPPNWQKLPARLMLATLYLLMIGTPLLGWLILSAEAKPIPFFGMELPALIGKNKDLAEWIEEIHRTIGTAGYFFIGLHAAAALFHHYVLRDSSLRNMLPTRN